MQGFGGNASRFAAWACHSSRGIDPGAGFRQGKIVLFHTGVLA